ncbi:hypothetical protein [Halomonas sp.]|uniref:hypothetical protein n=1 Tax=Halomonas sp. TaxID=1486246 RepID=UPI003D0D3F67
MFSHLPRHIALAGCLVIAVIGSTALVAQAATVGLQLAPGLSAEERAAIERQVADTLGGQAQACEGEPEAGAPCNAPAADTTPTPRASGQADRSGDRSADSAAATGGWQTPAVERSPSSRPLNREEASPLISWMQQLRVEVDRPDDQRPILVLVRNGQLESAWLWRDEVPLDTAPLVLRSERSGQIESGAVLGEFFRHAQRLDTEALRWLPRQWRGLERDGWHILRYGDLRGEELPMPPRSPLSAPSPWEFSR